MMVTYSLAAQAAGTAPTELPNAVDEQHTWAGMAGRLYALHGYGAKMQKASCCQPSTAVAAQVQEAGALVDTTISSTCQGSTAKTRPEAPGCADMHMQAVLNHMLDTTSPPYRLTDVLPRPPQGAEWGRVQALLERYLDLLPQVCGCNAEDLQWRRMLFAGQPCYRSAPTQPQFDRILQVSSVAGFSCAHCTGCALLWPAEGCSALHQPALSASHG